MAGALALDTHGLAGRRDVQRKEVPLSQVHREDDVAVCLQDVVALDDVRVVQLLHQADAGQS